MKTIALTIAGIITLAIILTIIQFLLRKVRSKSEADFRIRLAYGVWFACLFIAGCVVAARIVTFLSEAIDNIFKMGLPNTAFEIAKVTSLYIGLGVIWFLIWYFIAKVFSVIIAGNRNELEEMELNNTCFFLIKGLIVIGFIFCLSPVLEMIFRMVMPNIQLPFYH